jgi:hypothetical protein
LSLPNGAVLFHSDCSLSISACAILPPWCKEAPMEVRVFERRNSPRHLLRTALRVRTWKSGNAEQRAESQNLSERAFFSPPTRHWLSARRSRFF